MVADAITMIIIPNNVYAFCWLVWFVWHREAQLELVANGFVSITDIVLSLKLVT